MIGSFTDNRPINMVGPVNWLEPLNRGLVAWWLCLPGLMGGSRLVNIARAGDKDGSHGTLTNMNPANAWVGGGRPGGWGALSFTRSDDLIDLGQSAEKHPCMRGIGDWTISVMLFVRSVNSDGENDIYRVQTIGGSANGAFVLRVGTFGAGNTVWGISRNNGSWADYNANTSTGLNQWRMITVTRSASALNMYLDGAPDGSAEYTEPTNNDQRIVLANVYENGSGSIFGSLDGLIQNLLIYNRALSASEVHDLYLDSLQFHRRTLNRIPTTRHFLSAAGPTTFTGSGTLTAGAATASGSATFTAPVYTATGALTAGAATASGTATSIYTGTATLTVGATTASGSATFTAPVYTGTGTFTVGAATASGSATFAAPVYTGTGTLTVGAATASGSATFTAPVYTGTGSFTIGAATASGTATFAAPVYTGSGALTVGAATLSGSATFVAPVYTGTGALTAGAATASGSATFTAPVYTGSGVLTIGAATASGSATFTAPVYTGTAALTVGAATASGSATFTAPVYTGSGALTVGAATASGSATFTAPVYTGTGALIAGAATASGSATFSGLGIFTATGTFTVGAATAAGTATFVAPEPTTHTATGVLTVGAATMSGSATLSILAAPCPYIPKRQDESSSASQRLDEDTMIWRGRVDEVQPDQRLRPDECR